MSEETQEEVEYRKFDSEDVVRLRGNSVLASIEGGEGKGVVNIGKLQKVAVCLGVKKCPWFADEITEEKGVTEPIFSKRMNEEFRKVPVDKIDKLFKEVQAFNNAQLDQKDFQKK
jgi:predicted nucleic acid-binding Zn finger protein